MDINIINTMSEKERIAWLEAHAYSIETKEIERQYTPVELADLKDSLSDLMVHIRQADDLLNKAKLIYKESTVQEKAQANEIVSKLKNGFELVDTEVYGIDDQEAGTMSFYTKDGTFISSRPLFPKERQRKIFTINQ